MGRFHRDVELVFWNCEKFNAASPSLVAYARHLRRFYRSLFTELVGVCCSSVCGEGSQGRVWGGMYLGRG
jgi:hypothetical protein